jgi:hypothetical protein
VHPGLIVGARLLEGFCPHRLHAKLARERLPVLGERTTNRLSRTRECDIVRLAAANDKGREHHEKRCRSQHRDRRGGERRCFVLRSSFHSRPGGPRLSAILLIRFMMCSWREHPDKDSAILRAQ